MTDKLRADAQAALETLDILSKLGNGDVDGNSKGNEIAQAARQNLRAALAEQTVKESLTVAEPIGWVHWLTVDRIRFPQLTLMPRTDKDEPLYTAPPRREWVGLTAEDMADAHNSTTGDLMMRLAGFARAIEAKLREKNGG